MIDAIYKFLCAGLHHETQVVVAESDHYPASIFVPNVCEKKKRNFCQRKALLKVFIMKIIIYCMYFFKGF